MRFDRLDLNLLVALNALLERRSVTTAAVDLCLSQSAMSGALNRLREFFDDPLLVPVGRGLQLTDKALQLQRPVNDLLLFIRTNIMTAQQFDPANSDRLFTILASDYAYTVLVGAVIQEIERVAPNIKLQVVPFSEGSVARFLKGEIDVFLAIAIDPPPELKSRHLYYDDHVIIFWDRNPHIAGEIDLKKFLELDHVSVSFGMDQQPTITDVQYAKAGLTRNVKVSVPTFSALAEAVVGTDRIATVHSRLAKKLAEIYPIKVAATPFKFERVEEVVQWHTINDSNQGTQWLISQIVKTAQDLLEANA